jgi:hypothetical protein
MRRLKLNFETNVLSIVDEDTDKSIAEDQYCTECVNIPDNNFYVMQINGICTSDSKFTWITNAEFYEIVNNYIKQFELTPEEIKVSNKKFNLEDLTVDEIKYEFDANLCSFTLYSISTF